MRFSGKLIAGLLALPILLAGSYFYSQQAEEKPSFYKDAMHGHDVWRLPIIEPHELITADCFTECNGWNYQTNPHSFNPDSLNFQHGLILFHDEETQHYGFLNIKTNKLTQLLSHQQFADSLRKLSLSSRLFNTNSVYKCWRETGQLPWAAEILATQECGLLKR